MYEDADRQPPGVDQAVLAAFMSEGHFAPHVRRMRVLYADCRTTLREASVRRLAAALHPLERC